MYRLKLRSGSEIDFAADDDEAARGLVAEYWPDQDVSALDHVTGPPHLHVLRRVWTSPA